MPILHRKSQSLSALPPPPPPPQSLLSCPCAVDNILHLTLLKHERRGKFYGEGRCNADTYWKSIVKGAAEAERLPFKYPPSDYYWTTWEMEDGTAGGSASSDRLHSAAPKAILSA